MCAEAVPWRCHRSLVADALAVRGIGVVEILSETSYRDHALTPFARVSGTAVTYPPAQDRCSDRAAPRRVSTSRRSEAAACCSELTQSVMVMKRLGSPATRTMRRDELPFDQDDEHRVLLDLPTRSEVVSGSIMPSLGATFLTNSRMYVPGTAD